jgi:hypothetical protein
MDDVDPDGLEISTFPRHRPGIAGVDDDHPRDPEGAQRLDHRLGRGIDRRLRRRRDPGYQLRLAVRAALHHDTGALQVDRVHPGVGQELRALQGRGLDVAACPLAAGAHVHARDVDTEPRRRQRPEIRLERAVA